MKINYNNYMEMVIRQFNKLHKDSKLFFVFCLLAILFSISNILIYIFRIEYMTHSLRALTFISSVILGGKIVCFLLLAVDTWKQRINNSIFLMNFLTSLEVLMIPNLALIVLVSHKFIGMCILYLLSVPIMSILLILQRKTDIKKIETDNKKEK